MYTYCLRIFYIIAKTYFYLLLSANIIASEYWLFSLVYNYKKSHYHPETITYTLADTHLWEQCRYGTHLHILLQMDASLPHPPQKSTIPPTSITPSNLVSSSTQLDLEQPILPLAYHKTQMNSLPSCPQKHRKSIVELHWSNHTLLVCYWCHVSDWCGSETQREGLDHC